MLSGRCYTRDPRSKSVQFRINAFSWAPVTGPGDFDGSLKIQFRVGGARPLNASLHLRLTADAAGVCTYPLSLAQLGELATHILKYGRDFSEGRWYVTGPPPDTAASRYGHPARSRLDRDLGLPSEGWMQDWPLEVARWQDLDRYLEYYDAAGDDPDSDDVRHDAMWLALHAAEHRLEPAPRWEWFAERIRARFPLHAHAVFQIGSSPDDGFGGRLHALGLGCLIPIPPGPVGEAQKKVSGAAAARSGGG